MNPRLVACLKRLTECRRTLNDLAPESHAHSCYRQLCNPLNEHDMVRLGVLPSNSIVIMPNVWLCRYGSFHVCDYNCNQASEGTCPISGISSGSYIQNGTEYDVEDARTWNSNAAAATADHGPVVANNPVYEEHYQSRAHRLKRSALTLFDDDDDDGDDEDGKTPEAVEVTSKQRRRNVQLGFKEATRRAEQLVHSILYDNALRKRVLAHQMDEIEQARSKAWADAVLKCEQENTVLDLIQHMIIESNTPTLPLVDAHIQFNLARKQYYIDAIIEVYQKVLKFCRVTKMDIEALGIGVLYTMRTGLSVSGVQALPRDETLIKALPQLSVLPLFHYSKNKLTRGTAILRELYKSIVASGAVRSDIELTTVPVSEITLFQPRARDWKV